MNGVCVSSRSVSRGIWVIWDKGLVEAMDYKVNSFSVLIKEKKKSSDYEWLISGMYCPTNYTLTIAFFEELGSIRLSWSGPCCVGGDFNEVRELEERNGGSQI